MLVSSLDRSIEFYRNVLGYDVEFQYEDFYAGLIRDEHALHLKCATPVHEERKFRQANEHLDLTFIITELNTMYEYLKGKAVEITQKLRDMPHGREFYIADPEGYILAFMEEK